jgi:hypothetical protein
VRHYAWCWSCDAPGLRWEALVPSSARFALRVRWQRERSRAEQDACARVRRAFAHPWYNNTLTLAPDFAQERKVKAQKEACDNILEWLGKHWALLLGVNMHFASPPRPIPAALQCSRKTCGRLRCAPGVPSYSPDPAGGCRRQCAAFGRGPPCRRFAPGLPRTFRQVQRCKNSGSAGAAHEDVRPS